MVSQGRRLPSHCRVRGLIFFSSVQRIRRPRAAASTYGGARVRDTASARAAPPTPRERNFARPLRGWLPARPPDAVSVCAERDGPRRRQNREKSCVFLSLQQSAAACLAALFPLFFGTATKDERQGVFFFLVCTGFSPHPLPSQSGKPPFTLRAIFVSYIYT